MTVSADMEALFEAAKRVPVEAICGVTLHGGGRYRRGECPLYHKGRAERGSGPFSWDSQTNRWCCFACATRGDAIALEREIGGGSALAAAQRLTGERLTGETVQRAVRAPEPRPAPVVKAPVMPARLWEAAFPADRIGRRVRGYLSSRGIGGRVAEAALARLRFHSAAFWGFGEDGAPIHAPAMIARVVVAGSDGQPRATGGIHVTYLDPQGLGKSPLRPAKRMFGAQMRTDDDGVSRPGGILLGPACHDRWVVAEGIENALSAAVLLEADGQGPVTPLAAGSLDRLQGGWAKDRWGRVDLGLVRGDLARPAFVWPQPEHKPQLLIAVDQDMSPVSVKVRKAMGGTAEGTLDGEGRGRICGGLARTAWTMAGWPDVRVIGPRPGFDFNDELRARAADAVARERVA